MSTVGQFSYSTVDGLTLCLLFDTGCCDMVARILAMEALKILAEPVGSSQDLLQCLELVMLSP